MRFVEVDEGVRLEVLDWGGQGRPLVLLAGLGNTAHVFDELAVELTRLGHVYGVTRRGFGGSSRPESGFEVERLGQDVVAVLDVLALDAPVLAAYRAWSLRTLGYALPEAELRQIRNVDPGERVGTADRQPEIRQAVLAGSQRFTTIEVPALAIYASPHALGPWTGDAPEHRSAFEAFARFDQGTTARQANAFRRGVPRSRVVLLPDAHHFLFVTHEPEVVREIGAFVATLSDDAARR